MALKRLFQAAMAAVVLTAAVPASAQQVLKVGSTPTGIPFTFLDTKTNQISGIMVDIIKEIGKDQGFTPEVTPMTFSTLIAALQANKIDVIAAAMYITPTRQEVYYFGSPPGDTRFLDPAMPVWVRWLQPLLSGVFTVDNLDYVRRDAYMTGVAINVAAPGVTRFLSSEVFVGHGDGSISNSPTMHGTIGQVSLPFLSWCSTASRCTLAMPLSGSASVVSSARCTK